jgi:hypothetical protein
MTPNGFRLVFSWGCLSRFMPPFCPPCVLLLCKLAIRVSLCSTSEKHDIYLWGVNNPTVSFPIQIIPVTSDYLSSLYMESRRIKTIAIFDT